MWSPVLLFFALALLLTAVRADEHEDCQFWADNGECESNPGYMLTSCAEACAKKSRGPPVPPTADMPATLYDIVEKDIHGEPLPMSTFKGKVLYIVNVASYCGYTADNYEMFRKLKPYRDQGFEIILAPCNQFGFQEPGDGTAITTFAQEKQQFEGVILSKADVNGPETRPLFAFLKHVTSKDNIDWNFDGKFLVSRDGQISHLPPGIDVEREIREMVGSGEL